MFSIPPEPWQVRDIEYAAAAVACGSYQQASTQQHLPSDGLVDEVVAAETEAAARHGVDLRKRHSAGSSHA